MSFKTKVVVLQMKEIVYTVIFIRFAILLISLPLIMSRPKKDAVPSSVDASAYVPGVYTASLVLGSQNVNMEVTVDTDHINSVALPLLSDPVTIMCPLMQPVFEDLAKQVRATQSTENLSYSMETRRASAALINVIEQALHKVGIKDAQ